nr:hypothetical protein [Ruegeria arenilitoris]
MKSRSIPTQHGRSSVPCAGSVTTGRFLLRAAVFCAAWVPAAAVAQTRISPEAFLDAVVGKTVTFHELTSGMLVGTEEFLSPNRSVWRREGEGCVYGQITTPDGKLCFLYDTEPGPVCWWPFEHDGRLLVRIARLGDGEIQEVSGFSDDGLDCPSVPIS